MPQSHRQHDRRISLAYSIEQHGTIMVKPCNYCSSHKKVCKVHIRSGRCGECVRRGRRCNLQVTRSEWTRLRAQRDRLTKELESAHAAQRAAQVTEERAREDRNKAFAKEMRVRREMDLLEGREADAIAAEEHSIEEEEFSEFLELGHSSDFNLSPSTWDLMNDQGYDFSSDFWIQGPSSTGNFSNQESANQVTAGSAGPSSSL